MIKKLSFKKFSVNILIILSFLIISYLCLYSLINTHRIAFLGDIQFHWQRFNELHQDMMQGNWFPGFANHYFSEVGSDVMSLYPYITILPFSLLLYFIKSPVTFFNWIFFIFFFLTMILAYYSSLGFNKRRSISYLFAVTYSCLSNNLFWQNDIGMWLAIVLLPISIFGFLSFLKSDRWLELSIGVSLLVLTHVISALIVIITFIIWFLCDYRVITKRKLLQLVKAVIMTISCTSVFWIPALNLGLHNQLVNPDNMFMNGGVNWRNIFLDALLPYHYIIDHQFTLFTVNIVALVTAFIGLVTFKKLSKIDKQIYVVSIILLLAYSSLFPWQKLINTPVNLIQSPCRMYIIPQILLDYLFAVIIIHYVISERFNWIKMILVVLTVIAFQSQYQRQQIIHNLSGAQSQFIIYKGRSNSNFRSRIFNRTGRDDYYPQATARAHFYKQINRSLRSTINHTRFVNYGNDVIKFKDNHRRDLSLPYLYYHGVRYKVSVNGHQVSYACDNNHQLLKIPNVSLHKGTVKIKEIPTEMKSLSIMAFLLSLLIYIGFIIKRLI